MRQQPMLVTALITFIALITVLRPAPMLDCNHDGVDDTEQMFVIADDGCVYVKKSYLPTPAEEAQLFGYGYGQKDWTDGWTAEVVDAEWVRFNAKPYERFNIVSADGSEWLNLPDTTN